MNRWQSLVALGSSVLGVGNGVPGQSISVAPIAQRSARANASEFRWLVPVSEYRVGVLADVGAMTIAREHEARSIVLNIPRATRNDTGWRVAKPPEVPYSTRSQQISDAITYGGPDRVTVGAAIGFQAVFGIEVPGAAAPNYLVRVTPRTLEMQTFALPDDAHGPAIALYKTGHQLTIVRQDESLLRIEYD